MAKIKRWPSDIAFSNAIRLNKDHICEHCGNGSRKMECAHIYSRRHKSIRWDVQNALCLCFTCHLHFTGNPLDFTAWLEDYLGQGALDILREKRNQIMKATPAVKAEIAKHYRAEFRRMESTGSRALVSY